MDLRTFEKNYRIHVYETGPDGKLALPSLFDYLQDIASDHAVRLGYGRDDLLKLNQFWVLSRICAETAEMPEWGKTVTVKTWPRGVDKLFALRDFEVHDTEGRLIAAASSSWLIIDRKTRRIQRPDNTLSNFKPDPDLKNALPRNAQKIELARVETRNVSFFKVRLSDLDINLHTNNTRYLKWVIDTLTPEFIMNNIPVFTEINYLAESRFNEEIVISMYETGDKNRETSYSVTRQPDDAELCRVRIFWRNNHLTKTELI